jgi:hypothetical protein
MTEWGYRCYRDNRPCTPTGDAREVFTAEDLEPGSADPCDPKTVAEQLDAAESGEEFGQVLLGLFGALDRAREAEAP